MALFEAKGLVYKKELKHKHCALQQQFCLGMLSPNIREVL